MDDLVGVVAVELDQGERALIRLLALLRDERVEAIDHIAPQAAHGPRAVDEEGDVHGDVGITLLTRPGRPLHGPGAPAGDSVGRGPDGVDPPDDGQRVAREPAG